MVMAEILSFVKFVISHWWVSIRLLLVKRVGFSTDKHYSLDSEDDFPVRSLKRQSPTTVLCRTTLARTIIQYELIISIRRKYLNRNGKRMYTLLQMAFFYLTIRLSAQDFYEVMVDEAEAEAESTIAS